MEGNSGPWYLCGCCPVAAPSYSQHLVTLPKRSDLFLCVETLLGGVERVFSRLSWEFKAMVRLWAQLELWKEVISPIYCIAEQNWTELIEALAGIQTFISLTLRSLMAGTLSRLPSCPQLQRRADTWYLLKEAARVDQVLCFLDQGNSVFPPSSAVSLTVVSWTWNQRSLLYFCFLLNLLS